MSASPMAPAKPKLNLYVLMEPAADRRVQHITRILNSLKALADHHHVVLQVHSLSQPSASDVERLVLAKDPHLEPRLNPRFAADDPLFEKYAVPLNVAEISNYERYRTALQVIAGASSSEGHIVLEDDVIVLPSFETHWTEWFQWFTTTAAELRTSPVQMGIFTMTLNRDTAPFQWCPYSELSLTSSQPLLPSKEILWVQPSIAKDLWNYTETIGMTMRQTLSRWLYHRIDTQTIWVASKRLAFDGSKLGLFPSTLHPNNLLIYNHEYMEMLRLMSAPPDQKNKATLSKWFKAIASLKSPDAYHLYAVLLFHIKSFEDAKEAFEHAVSEMIEQKGFVNRQSELLHNAIEFYRHYQKEEWTHTPPKPSKYSKIFALPSGSRG